MILRVDPGNNSASLLSIPRDTWVPVAPRWSKTKINARTAATGGPENLISTIKHNFGIPIDNFVEVDWAGFRQVVEVLGGVPVYLDHPISRPQDRPLVGADRLHRDRSAAGPGLRAVPPLPSTRKVRPTASGRNGRPTRPATSAGSVANRTSFARPPRQRSTRDPRNPTTASDWSNAGLGAVKVDERLSIGQIVDLIGRVPQLRGRQPRIPAAAHRPPVGRSGSVSYQNVLWDEAERSWTCSVASGRPARSRPLDVIVDLAPDSIGTPATLAGLLDRGLRRGSEDDSSVQPARAAAAHGRPVRSRRRRIGAGSSPRHLDGEGSLRILTTLPGRRLELAVPDAGPDVSGRRRSIRRRCPLPTIPQTAGSSRTTTTVESAATTTATTTTTPSSNHHLDS